MPRLRPVGDDATLSEELDPAFTGVNNLLAPSVQRSGHPYYRLNQEILAPGMVTDAQNVRMQDGQAMTRGGMFPPRQFQPTAPIEYLGAGIFSDPNGRELMLVATAAGVWLLADGLSPRLSRYADGVTMTQRVSFAQCFQAVIMFRGTGDNAEPLEWGGGILDRWRPVSQTDTGESADFLEPTPAADHGVVMAGRLFVPVSRDAVAWSDLLDYTRFDLTLGQARFNEGEDDAIVALKPYQGRRLVVFKDQSVYFMDGVSGGLEGIAVDRLRGVPGCRARRSVAEADNDLLWLGPGGVYSLSQTQQDSLRGAALPVSWPVQRWIDRINWRAAGNAVACVDAQRHLYYLAVPIDGSETNNAILVYDYAGKQWQSMDLPPARVTVRDLVVTDLWGQRTPFLVMDAEPWQMIPDISQPTLQLAVLAMGTGDTDWFNGEPYDIRTVIETRGYVLGDLSLKRVQSLTANVATQHARLTFTAVADGVNEETVLLANVARDRRRWSTWGKPARNLDNSADDFTARDREDYTWISGDGPYCGSGLRADLLQEWLEPLPVRTGDTRWLALRVECDRGRMVLRSVTADGTGDKNLMRPQT